MWQLFRELKRRNVYKVAVAYLAVVFVGLQAAELLVPATTLSAWADDLLIYLAVFGFPIALVVAWAFELTPEGVRRTPESEKEGAPNTPEKTRGTRRALQILAALGLMAVAGAGVWQFTPLGDGHGATEAATPRIAVLPFENISRDTGDAGFARGMYEEVLNQLSKVSNLAVLPRTTGVKLAELEMTAAEIGREHDVQAIMEGSVERAGDRLRIRTHLIEAPDDEQLWSNSYERGLSVSEIFDIQADIAEQIAGALETERAGGERECIEDPPTDDLAAYKAFLRGRGQVWEFLERWIPRAFGPPDSEPPGGGRTRLLLRRRTRLARPGAPRPHHPRPAGCGATMAGLRSDGGRARPPD